MTTTRDGRPDDDASAPFTCENAASLVPGYLDGELTEAQAGPLRAHLLACPACREEAKGERNLKSWFTEAAAPAVEVPPGFAARVARRAFAGDPGILTPATPAAATDESSRILPFLLQLTAVAAGLLMVFAVAIHQTRNLPDGDGLEAGDTPPWENESPAAGFQPRRAAPLDRAAETDPAPEETGR